MHLNNTIGENASEATLQDYFFSEDLCILHKMKLNADDKYYNTGETTGLSDSEYDILKTVLERRDPDYVVPIGTRIRESENRVELPFWLGSMNKIASQSPFLAFDSIERPKIESEMQEEGRMINTEEVNDLVKQRWEELSPEERDDYWRSDNEKEVRKWLSENLAKDYVIESKLDGVSCLLVMKKGKIKLYTRGDGVIGANISYLSQYFSSIPKDLDKTMTIRGELIMGKDVFQEKHSDHANPRNLVAGRIGAKTVRQGIEDIEFVAYEIVGDGEMPKPSVQLSELSRLGFTVVENRKITRDCISVEYLCTQLAGEKKTSKYEIDGIIIQSDLPYDRNTSGNPDYAFAFKMMSEDDVQETTVVQIDWRCSKWGVLKPRIVVEPVQTGGVTITHATAFNAKYVVEKGIGPGARIAITRSGDVIPYIVEVLESAEPVMPEIGYHWNETEVDIIADEEQKEAKIKRIANFFAKLKIKHVAEKNVAKMYNAGHRTIFSIITATQEDLAEIEGFGERLAERTCENIEEGLCQVPLATMVGASGILGFGVGRKRAELLLSGWSTIFEDWKGMSKTDIRTRIAGVDGFAARSAYEITEMLQDATEWLEEMSMYATFKEVEKVSSNLEGMKIVMSGFRDSDMEEGIIARGGKVTSSISKTTTFLVVASIGGKKSAKIEKAEKQGTRVMCKEEFREEFLEC
jgi:NAD-dependent DNA ligase